MHPSALSIVNDAYSAFGRGDLEGILALLDPAVVWRYNADPAAVPYAGEYRGREGVADFFGKLMSAVAFTDFMPEEFHEAGQTIAVIGRETATVSATGKTFSGRWVHLFTVVDGLVTRWEEFNDSGSIAAAFQAG